MNGKPIQGDEVVVARFRDRTFRVPRRFEFGTWLLEEGLQVEASVEIRNGRPTFREVTLRAIGGEGPLTPLDVQRFPWAKLAEWAIEARAVDDEGVRLAGSAETAAPVRQARAATAKREHRTSGPLPHVRRRNRVTDDRLREVLQLRAEAQALGVRWDTYAADRLHVTPSHARKLAGQAVRRGLAPLGE